MKELFTTILNSPENYAEWPLHKKQLFWAAANHIAHRDQVKFEMIYRMVQLWAEHDETHVRFAEKEPEPRKTAI